MTVSAKRRKTIYDFVEGMVDMWIEDYALDIGTDKEEQRKNFVIKKCLSQFIFQSNKTTKQEEQELLTQVALETWNKKIFNLKQDGLEFFQHCSKLDNVVENAMKDSDIHKFKIYVEQYDDKLFHIKILSKCIKENYYEAVRYMAEVKNIPLNIEHAVITINKSYFQLLQYYVDRGGDIHESEEYLLYCSVFHRNKQIQHYLVDLGAKPLDTKSRLENSSDLKELLQLEQYRQKKLELTQLNNKLEANLVIKEKNTKIKL